MKFIATLMLLMAVSFTVSYGQGELPDSSVIKKIDTSFVIHKVDTTYEKLYPVYLTEAQIDRLMELLKPKVNRDVLLLGPALDTLWYNADLELDSLEVLR